MVTIGVVGTGIFATQKHLPAIQKTEGLDIRGAYNRTKEKAEKFTALAGPNVKVFETLEELISSKDIDTIDALLPVEQNLSVVKAALKAGKPISFEKPIAADLEDGAEIVRLAEATDIPVIVLENWCYHHGTVKLRELLPQIGPVHMFNYQASGPFRKSAYHDTTWRQNPKHVGGFLSDSGVHDVALITEVLGPIGSVSARTSRNRAESGAEDTMNALFNMSDGKVYGTYTQARYSAACEPVLRLQIFGENGTLVYDKPGSAGGKITLRKGRSNDDAKVEEFTLPEDELNGVVAEFANWRDALRDQDKTKIVSTPRKAFGHYATFVAAMESAEQGGKFVHVKSLD